MGFWDSVDTLFTAITDPIKEAKQNIVRNYLIQDSLTCRCGGMAVPVFNTTNKYLCVSCGARFANARHRLYQNMEKHSDISQITYDKVILQLQKEAQTKV